MSDQRCVIFLKNGYLYHSGCLFFFYLLCGLTAHSSEMTNAVRAITASISQVIIRLSGI